MKTIRLLVIEDNRLLRDGIASMLKKQSDMHVVATVSNGENILMTMEKHKPNIVLLDLGLRNQ
ncbi:MAG: response regulator, partial [Bacteroidetes bacterium]|nr:response regulator [Bacteroidota bacterium]MBU1422664.1 response regulator [Bacteroidota bacterium]